MTEQLSEEAGLAQIQRWMQGAMLAPDGPPGTVEHLLTGSSRLSARERLAVYWRGYRLRLLESMRGLHPGVCHLLGRQLFDQFALDYLDAHPSSSYSLFRLNDRFAEHLARTRPDAQLPAAERESWPDLVIDLARFERTFDDVLGEPGTEDGEVLDIADLLPQAGRRWPDAVLRPAPCLRLLHTRFPVHEYVSAVHRGDHPPLPACRPTFLVLGRRDYRVFSRELSPVAYRVLRALTRGETVRVALRDVDPAVGTAWLADWSRRRFFTTATFRPPSGEPAPRRTDRDTIAVRIS